MKLPATVLAAAAAAVVCSSSLYAGQPSSWIFNRGTFTHDPQTGARVAQYWRTPPVEPLPDTRAITSGFRRTRTTLRGTDGSLDTYHRVENWGNGRGGLDAEWERFHRAWQNSIVTGSVHQSQGFHPSRRFGPGFGRGGFHSVPPQTGFPHGTAPHRGSGFHPGFGGQQRFQVHEGFGAQQSFGVAPHPSDPRIFHHDRPTPAE